MSNVRPLEDHILVLPIDEDAKSKGGIVIPDVAKDKPTRAKVIAVGRGRLLDNGHLEEPRVRKGETVLFGRYSGTEVLVDGKKHIIMREAELLAVIE